MATCACCGTTVFLAKKADGNKYCNANCLARGPIYQVAKTLPDDLVLAEARKIFASPCPVCRGSGPTDVHYSHRIWSAVLMTSWNSRARFSCKSCGVKDQASALAYSVALGWWGIPWGILGTPWTASRNVYGMVTKGKATQPSGDLLTQTRSLLAAQSIGNARLERTERAAAAIEAMQPPRATIENGDARWRRD